MLEYVSVSPNEVSECYLVTYMWYGVFRCLSRTHIHSAFVGTVLHNMSVVCDCV